MSAKQLGRQVVSLKPITIPSPGRGIELQVKVTAPLPGGNLPVIVFSHGNAWSLDGYEPLVDRWAAAGFVVVQPTHLDSRRNGIGFDDPRFATIWRVRISDLHAVLDNLDHVLARAAVLDIHAEHACSTLTAWPERTSPTLRSRQARSSRRPAPGTRLPRSPSSTCHS
jgi:predicted dienelactone hydrolase